MQRSLLVTACQTLHDHLAALRFEDARAVIESASISRTLADLFVELLEPAIYRAGVEVADRLIAPEVELATVELVRTMVDRLGRRGPWRAPKGRMAIAATAPGETHTLGLEMVTTLLTRDGWRVLRTSAEGDDLSSRLVDRPDLVCLSVTCPEHLEAVTALIERIHEASPSTRVMLGGLAPRLVPERAVRAGADLFAEDARAALATVRATFGRIIG